MARVPPPLPRFQPMHPRRLLRCAAAWSEEEPWLFVHGDSTARALYFDLATLLNRSVHAVLADEVHPGHAANFSTNCARMESRPPLHRRKCSAFELSAPLPTVRTPYAAGALAAGTLATAEASRSDGRIKRRLLKQVHARRLRLSFRLKAFGWESDLDERILSELEQSPRLPDALIVGFGLWDMQYPPGFDPPSSGTPMLGAASAAALRRAGLVAFNASARRYVRALSGVLRRGAAQGAAQGGSLANGGKGRRRRTTRLLFLRVGALSSERLPPWKRSHMDSELSVQYSAILSDAIAPYGWRMLDTFSSGASHPEESPDGVHYPGRISHYHTHLMLNAICES